DSPIATSKGFGLPVHYSSCHSFLQKKRSPSEFCSPTL
ncbi:hypothetical protein AVDCRST_MAG94-6438, partial [uncultured Leptolyngbya sp.]